MRKWKEEEQKLEVKTFIFIVGVVGVVACRKESLWRFFVKGTCKWGNYCAVYHG